jgi:hypothetical protein
MDEKERQSVALKKFSLISPVLNGQETNATDYFCRLSAEPVQMPGKIGIRTQGDGSLVFGNYEQNVRLYACN